MNEGRFSGSDERAASAGIDRRAPVTLVINLAGSTERWNRVTVRLSDLGIVHDRVDAVDSRQCDPQMIARFYSNDINRKTWHRELTPGEIGCYLSHYQCWERISDTRLECALILEDDAVPDESLITLLNSVTQLPTGWDVIKLATGPRVKKVTAQKPIPGTRLSLVSFAKVPSTTTAQLVSASGARKLMQARGKFGRPVDVDFQFFWEANLNIYGINPFPVHADPAFDSDISALTPRHARWQRRWRRLQQRCEYEILNRRHRTALGQDRP